MNLIPMNNFIKDKVWTLTTTVSLAWMQYSSTSIIWHWHFLPLRNHWLTPLERYPKSHLHIARLRLKYYSNTCIHPILHLPKFPSFILDVIKSIDRNIHLYLLNHIHSLVITINTGNLDFPFLKHNSELWCHTSTF